MSIQDLGSIGELIAAVATIATLFYLATQIRQSTRTEKAGQSQEFVRWRTQLLDPILNNSELAELWVKAERDYDGLSPAEKTRIFAFESRAISGWNHYFHMHREGLVNEHQWREMVSNIERYGQRASLRAAWRDTWEGFEDDFREFGDHYMQ